MFHPILISSLLTVALWQSSAADASQLQTAPHDVPTMECSIHHIEAITPIRITVGHEQIPYHFACGVGRSRHMCVSTLPPDLVVNLGMEQNGWACVTGGDSTSGWIPVASLAEVPADPKVQLAEWLGWWRQGKEVKGKKGNRLFIANIAGTHILHVSGRAYWYGLNDNVHFGEVQADAIPIGIYLHLVDSDSCVVDLKLEPTTHTLDAYDNMQCGGMNVRFDGKWSHYAPKLH